jgi:hypothetical protein
MSSKIITRASRQGIRDQSGRSSNLDEDIGLDEDTHDMIVDTHEDTEAANAKKKEDNSYKGGGKKMARDIVSYFLLRFFFTDITDKRKINRMKDDFLKDLNFSVMTGKVSRATNYLASLPVPEVVSKCPRKF